MPPQKKDKKKHYRGKQFSTFEEDGRDQVKWRNNRAPGQEDGGSSSSDGEHSDTEKSKAPAVDPKKPPKTYDELQAALKGAKNEDDSDDDGRGQRGFERCINNMGLNPTDADLANEPLSRRQREEIDKEARKRAYEKKHAEGKTEEAQSDLARLKKIREERERIVKERQEREKAEATSSIKTDTKKEFVAALGGEASRRAEKKKKKKKGAKDSDSETEAPSAAKKSSSDKPAANYAGLSTAPYGGVSTKPTASTGAGGASSAPSVHQDTALGMYDAYKTDKKADLIDKDNVVKGTVDACRAEEEDFM